MIPKVFFNLETHANAFHFVKQHHYSHRMPTSRSIVAIGTWRTSGGLLGEGGEIVAACIFGVPPTRWSEKVIELSRLAHVDRELPPLTTLVNQTIDQVRRIDSDYHLAIANIDVNFSKEAQFFITHWNFGGQRDRHIDGVVLNDSKFIPGRSANSRWNTRSPEKLQEMGINAKAHYDDGKLFFWRPLDHVGSAQAERLELKRLDFHKEMIRAG